MAENEESPSLCLRPRKNEMRMILRRRRLQSIAQRMRRDNNNNKQQKKDEKNDKQIGANQGRVWLMLADFRAQRAVHVCSSFFARAQNTKKNKMAAAAVYIYKLSP